MPKFGTPPGPPTTTSPEQDKISKQQEAEALKAYKAYEKAFKNVNMVFQDLAKEAKPSVGAMSDFTKAVKSLTKKAKEVEYQLDTNKKAAILEGIRTKSRISPIGVRQGFWESISNQYTTRIWGQKAQDFFAGRNEREQNRISRIRNRFRSGLAGMSEKWLAEDAASPTGRLGLGGKTTPLSPGFLKRNGIVDAIVQDIAKPSAVTQRNISKATDSLIQRITAPFMLRNWGRGTQAFAPGGATTTALGGGGATAPLLAGATTPLGPRWWNKTPNGPRPAGQTRPARRSWAGTAAGLFATYEAGKSIYSNILSGADYDLATWRDYLKVSTQAPTLDMNGSGLRGLKSTTGRFGGPRSGMGPFGPTTPAESRSALYSDIAIKQALTGAGVSVADWPKIFSTYGVRGGWKNAAMLSAVASQDLDLGYKGFSPWLQFAGRMTELGYGGANGQRLPGIFEAMRGSVQAAGLNNISKGTFDTTVTSTLEKLSSMQALASPTGLTNFIGGTMGGSQLPQLRSGAGIESGLTGVSGALGNVNNNPYLFTILSQIYKQSGGNWTKALGPVAAGNMPMLNAAKGLPLAYQLSILGGQMAFDPQNVLPAITKYLKRKGMNPALGMLVEENILGASGVDRGSIGALVQDQWFGKMSSTSPFGGMGRVDKTLMGKTGGVGDIEAILAHETAKGYGKIAAGERASDLANSIVALDATEVGLNKTLNALINKVEELVSLLPGAAPRLHVGPLPSSGPKIPTLKPITK